MYGTIFHTKLIPAKLLWIDFSLRKRLESFDRMIGIGNHQLLPVAFEKPLSDPKASKASGRHSP